MTKTKLSLATLALIALSALAPQAANAALICDEDGCTRAVVVSGPVFIEEDCGCDD